jgi:hypothetical protein
MPALFCRVEAGAQWELLPEGAPAGRAHSGPPQQDKSTKHVDSYIPLSRNNITLYATELELARAATRTG